MCRALRALARVDGLLVRGAVVEGIASHSRTVMEMSLKSDESSELSLGELTLSEEARKRMTHGMTAPIYMLGVPVQTNR